MALGDEHDSDRGEESRPETSRSMPSMGEYRTPLKRPMTTTGNEIHVFKDGTRVPKYWTDRYTRRPRTSLSFATVTDERVVEITDRVSRPTISWTGGASLRDKDYCYFMPPVTKTNPRIPRLNHLRQMKYKKISDDDLNAIVNRLYTRHTTAWKSNISPNPHSRFS